MVTHLFNPQHDLALSEGNPWYKAPQSALQFQKDCALLPVWYANEGDAVLSPMPDNRWWNELCSRFPRLKNITIKQTLSQEDVLEPWGHDAEVYYRLGIKPQVDIARLKALSDRQTTCKAFEWLAAHGINTLPQPPVTLQTIDSIEDFIATTKHWVLKLPFSSSGIGIIKGERGLDTGMRNRLKTELKRNGHIMGEPLYHKVVDFAMLFELRQGQCQFKGYSLFSTTDKGLYDGNLLASNQAIVQQLSQKIDTKLLEQVKQTLCGFFETQYQNYNGPIGVDMMIYQDDNEAYQLNPMVEINLRYTMGWLARRFYDNFMPSNSQGILSLLRLNSSTLPHKAFSLCPINSHTQVAALIQQAQCDRQALATSLPWDKCV